jgi:hypothetical protein
MSAASLVERVKANLVALKMPRALEILDVTMRGVERGEIGALEAVDALLLEELTVRESRRIKMAVQMAKLAAIKTLAGFDFAFQPSLDKNRILALAGLQFIDRAEAVHLIGPNGVTVRYGIAQRHGNIVITCDCDRHCAEPTKGPPGAGESAGLTVISDEMRPAINVLNPLVREVAVLVQKNAL